MAAGLVVIIGMGVSSDLIAQIEASFPGEIPQIIVVGDSGEVPEIPDCQSIIIIESVAAAVMADVCVAEDGGLDGWFIPEPHHTAVDYRLLESSPFIEVELPENLAQFGRRLQQRDRYRKPATNRRTMFSKSGYLPKRIRAIRRAA